MTFITRIACLLIAVLPLAGCAPAPAAPAPAPARTAAPAPAAASAPTTAPASSASAPASAPAASAPAAAPASASAAAPASAPAAGPLSPPATVRMGVLGLTAEAGVYIALERGYFTQEGIVPEFTTLDTGARAIPALATGQLDVTGGGFSPAYVNAALRGVGMKMVAALMRSEPGSDVSYILVRKDLLDSGLVRDWADLRGRTIAIAARGSVNDYMVSKGLALGGVGYGDVNWVELSFPDQTAGLANGTVDIALSTDPLATLVAERGLATKWRTVSEYLPGASPAFMSFAPGFMSDQPEAARRFLAAYLRGARDYNAAFRRNENRDEAVQILIKHTTVKDASLYDRMAFGLIDPNGTINVSSVADQLQWYGEQGLLQGTLDVSSLMDTSYLDAALARLGPYQP